MTSTELGNPLTAPRGSTEVPEQPCLLPATPGAVLLSCEPPQQRSRYHVRRLLHPKAVCHGHCRRKAVAMLSCLPFSRETCTCEEMMAFSQVLDAECIPFCNFLQILASFSAEATADTTHQKCPENSSQTRVNTKGRAKTSTHSMVSASLPSTYHSRRDTETPKRERSASKWVETLVLCPGRSRLT